MNAVKNCLVVLAAAVALASCSADPNSSSAGKAAGITATPASLNMQLGTADSSNTMIVSAVDALGGPVDSKFALTVPAGSGFTAVIDTTYQPTNGGQAPGKATKVIVEALAASDGFFTITGTGGTLRVPVRIAPAPTGTSFALSVTAPAAGAQDTITAPSGTKFIGTISVTNAKGDSAAARQGAAPAGFTGMSADSSKLYFVVAPYAHGQLKVTMANRSTGTVTYPVVSIDSLAAAAFDTSNAAVAFNSLTPNFHDTVTATAPALFRWGAASAPTAPVGGGSAPVVVGYSSDSTQIRFVPGPGATGKVHFPSLISIAASVTHFPVTSASSITTGAAPAAIAANFKTVTPAGLATDTVYILSPYKFRANVTTSIGGVALALQTMVNDSTLAFIPVPASTGPLKFVGVYDRAADSTFTFTTSTATSITAGAAPVVATFSPAAPAVNVKDTIVLTNSAFRFRPTSTIKIGGLQAIVLSISADSSTMVALTPPGTSGAATIGNLWYSGAPATNFSLATAGTVTTGPVMDLGNDGPTGVIPTIQLPAKANYGFWDLGTFDSTDYSADGGNGAQYYRYNLGVAAKINTRVDWTVGTDIDVILVKDDGSFGQVDGYSGASAAAFETSKSNALTVGTYLLDVIDYGPLDGPGGVSAVGATIRYQITVF